MTITAGEAAAASRCAAAAAGLDAHADVRVIVPKGLTVRVRNGVGETSVTNAEGTLMVSVASSHLERVACARHALVRDRLGRHRRV